MDAVDIIRHDVQTRVRELGTEIIRFSEEKKSISVNADLSEADKNQRIAAARERLNRHLDAAFGEGEDSIKAGINSVLSTSAEAEKERAQASADIWIEELPHLRRFVQYCSDMIAADVGTPETLKGRKCLTETSVALDKISTRVEHTVIK